VSDSPATTRLYLITPPRFDAAAFSSVLAAALDAGDVAAVQLRLKEADDDTIRRACDRLRPVVQGRDVALILNDRPDLAAETGCDGVHVGQSDPPYSEARRRVGADRIVGLEVGADDYLPKPFNPRELLARIRAVLRRATLQQPGEQPRGRLIAFAGWTLDTLRREVTSADGVVVDLSGGEYDVLIAFVEHPNRILSREQLLELARNRESNAFDRSIDVQISRIRRKLEAGGISPPLIKTVRGAGYIFLPTVKRC